MALQMMLGTGGFVSTRMNIRTGAHQPLRVAAPRPQRHVMRAIKIAEIESPTKSEDKKSKKKEDDDDDFDGDEGLTPQQVESFLNVLCEETEIAEVELKMGGFKMKVRRSLKPGAAAAPVSAAPGAAAAPAAAAAAAAPAFSAAAPTDVEGSFDEDDGSLIAIPAPKVGTLRRGRYLKGKQIGKANAVEPGDTVKKGQILAYIEQLGTHWPVESPQAGELVDFLVSEGDAVEYQQAVAEIAPFFGGHIIGDSKYA